MPKWPQEEVDSQTSTPGFLKFLSYISNLEFFSILGFSSNLNSR